MTTCDSPHVLDAVPPSSMASLGAHPSLASRERDRRALPPSLSSLLRLLPPPPQSPRPLPQRGRAGERGQRRRRLNAVVSDAAHPYPPSAPPPPRDACPIGRTTRPRGGPTPPPSEAPCLPTMEMDDARDAAVAVAMAATQITILCFGGEMVGCQWDSR